MVDYCPNPIGMSLARIMRGNGLPKPPGASQWRPTGSRVHRNSPIYVGREGNFPRPIEKGWGNRLWWTAKRYDDRGRIANKAAKPGTREGPIGTAGLEVLRYLLDTIDRRTGMLYPAIATIAGALGRATQTVVNALRRLRDCGFLEWQRRVEPTGEKGLRGPQVRQASNLYRFTVPAELQRQIEVPLPDDEEWRRRQASDEAKRMLAQEAAIIDAMKPEEAVRAIFGQEATSGLAAALLRLAQNLPQPMSERDSSYQHESHESLNIMGEPERAWTAREHNWGRTRR